MVGDRTASVPGSRHRRRLLPMLIVAAVALSVVAAVLIERAHREPVTPATAADAAPSSAGDVPPAEDPPVGIDAEAAAVAEALRSATAAWSSHVTSVEIVAVLRRPVVSVATDIGSEQTDVSDEFSSAVATFLEELRGPDGSPYTYRVQIVSAEGDVIGWIEETDERWGLETPASPTDPAGLSAWLDAVYGAGSPQPEPWMDRVTSVDSDMSEDGYVVVRTDLDPEVYEDQAIAQTMIDAVRSSGATFAPGVRVLFSDGEFEWIGLLSEAPAGGS